MLSWHAFLVYCGVYALTIAIPGPGVVAIVARAMGGGFKSTVPAVFGCAIGDWVWMSLSALGMALVARAMGNLFLLVKLAGAAYLVYIAYKFWTAPTADLEPAAPARAREGFISQLVLTRNPKAIAFFLALLPTVVDLHRLTAVGYLQLSGATFLLIPTILLTYAAFASQVRGLMASAKARKRINRSAAVVMVGAAVGVAVS